MKTTNFKLLAILSIIIGIIGVIGCKEIEELIEGKVSTDCPGGIYADTIPNQLIVHFDPKTQSGDKIDIFKWLIDTLGASNIDTCPCDDDLALVEFPADKVIDLNITKRHADAKLTDEGKGKTYFNFEISYNPGAGIQNSIYTNKPVSAQEEIISIAILDGGLAPSFFPGYNLQEFSYDFTTSNPIIANTEINPHGTIVGKTIIADLAGIPIRLMDLRIFDKNGNGMLFNALCAISHSIEYKADIINMSWGYYAPVYDTLFLKYMEKTKNNNILVVTSAGNDSLNTDNCLHFPSGFNAASFPGLGNIISVASLKDSTDKLASYSNYGSSTIGIASYEGKVSGFEFIEGTSFAAPVVTNHAIKMIASSPSLTGNQIVDCIIRSAIPIAGLEVISNGKLNTSSLVCP